MTADRADFRVFRVAQSSGP